MERFSIVYTLLCIEIIFYFITSSGKAFERRPCFLEYAFPFRLSGERVLFSINIFFFLSKREVSVDYLITRKVGLIIGKNNIQE